MNDEQTAARVTPVFRQTDYPGTPDSETEAQLADLFASLFPGVAEPAFDQGHAGVAIAALNPELALNLARISGFLAVELPWCARLDLRELAIQTVNRHFGCEYSFRSRISIAEAAGVSKQMQDALDEWQESPLFSSEQRLVIEYAHATVTGKVPQPLFDRIKHSFGEKGAVECTAIISFWAFWAMFLNATRPDDDARNI